MGIFDFDFLKSEAEKQKSEQQSKELKKTASSLSQKLVVGSVSIAAGYAAYWVASKDWSEEG